MMNSQTFDGTGGGWQDGYEPLPLNQRTSLLAVASLVFGLLCFIPLFGVIGAICGIAALFLIGASGGRLAGRGMAVAGIISGLLFTSLWGGFMIGARYVMNSFTASVAGPALNILNGSQTGDFALARSGLAPAVAASATDADFTNFRDGYLADLGSFKGPPKSLFELIPAYAQTGPLMQRMSGRTDCIPVPCIFDKGVGLVIFQLDSASMENRAVTVRGKGGNVRVRTGNAADWALLKNIQVVAPNGSAYVLFDPGAGATPSGFGPDERIEAALERQKARAKAKAGAKRDGPAPSSPEEVTAEDEEEPATPTTPPAPPTRPPPPTPPTNPG